MDDGLGPCPLGPPTHKPSLARPLDGGVDFRGTQKEFFGDLGITGSFLPVLQEFYEHDHVLRLQMHVAR
jgi:hypothetical protein